MTGLGEQLLSGIHLCEPLFCRWEALGRCGFQCGTGGRAGRHSADDVGDRHVPRRPCSKANDDQAITVVRFGFARTPSRARRILSLRDQGRALRARRASQARPSRDLRPSRGPAWRAAHRPRPRPSAERSPRGSWPSRACQRASDPALQAANPSTAAASGKGRLPASLRDGLRPPLTGPADRMYPAARKASTRPERCRYGSLPLRGKIDGHAGQQALVYLPPQPGRSAWVANPPPNWE